MYLNDIDFEASATASGFLSNFAWFLHATLYVEGE